MNVSFAPPLRWSLVHIGDEEPTLPGSNLEDYSDPSLVWRSTDLDPTADLYAVIQMLDHGASWYPGVDFLGALYSNFSNTSADRATLRVRSATSSAALTDPTPAGPVVEDHGPDLLLPSGDQAAVYDRVSRWRWRHGWWRGSTPISEEFIRLDFSDANNADGYLEVGLLVPSAIVTPGRNAVYGARPPRFAESAARLETSVGVQHGVRQSRLRDAAVTFDLDSDEAIDLISELEEQRGASSPLVFAWDFEATRAYHGVFWALMEGGAETTMAHFNEYRKSFALRETMEVVA